MAGRRPVRIDNGEYAKCIRDTETLYPYKLSTGARDVFLGWWGERIDHPYDIYPDPGRRLIISEPEGSEDDIRLATHAWRVLGDRGFEVAAETGHQITDVARTLGYAGVYGVAAGNIKVATLAVASHTIPAPDEINALLPHLIDQTNKQLERDGVPLRLPLEGMLSSQARA